MTPAELKVCDALLEEIFDVEPLTPAGKFWLAYLAGLIAFFVWLIWG